MNNLRSNVLPLIAMGVILSPVAASMRPREDPAPVPMVREPDPAPVRQETDPVTWFSRIRPRCTPADVRLATDLNRPPKGVDGTGYLTACYALAHNIAKARALIIGLPEGDRLRGASVVYGVAHGLAARGRLTTAGPLMELVLEFWPNHYMALYEAGAARYAAGDRAGAQELLDRFLEVYPGNDALTVNAHRMIGYTAER